jgi:hypothetical protein
MERNTNTMRRFLLLVALGFNLASAITANGFALHACAFMGWLSAIILTIETYLKKS